jgi:hypothetical protein
LTSLSFRSPAPSMPATYTSPGWLWVVAVKAMRFIARSNVRLPIRRSPLVTCSTRPSGTATRNRCVSPPMPAVKYMNRLSGDHVV